MTGRPPDVLLVRLLFRVLWEAQVQNISLRHFHTGHSHKLGLCFVAELPAALTGCCQSEGLVLLHTPAQPGPRPAGVILLVWD